MKQFFDLECPYCNTPHSAHIVVIHPSKLTEVLPMPYACKHCGEPLRVECIENGDVLSYVFSDPENKSIIPGWGFWFAKERCLDVLSTSDVALEGGYDTLNAGDLPKFEEALYSKLVGMMVTHLPHINAHAASWSLIQNETSRLEFKHLCMDLWVPKKAFLENAEDTREFVRAIIVDVWGYCNQLFTKGVTVAEVHTTTKLNVLLRNRWFRTMVDLAANKMMDGNQIRRLFHEEEDGSIAFFPNPSADPNSQILFDDDETSITFEELVHWKTLQPNSAEERAFLVECGILDDEEPTEAYHEENPPVVDPVPGKRVLH